MTGMKPFRFTAKQEEKLEQWAEWLRTTYRKQGYEMLRLHPGKETSDTSPAEVEAFCCLGIYGIYRKPNNWSYDEENMSWELTVGNDYSSAQLPEFLAKELGLNVNSITACDDKGVVREWDIQDVFIRLNDVGRQSFHQIADEILYIVKHRQYSPDALARARLDLVETE